MVLARTKAGYTPVTGKTTRCRFVLEGEDPQVGHKNQGTGMKCDTCGIVFCEKCRIRVGDNLDGNHDCTESVIARGALKPILQTDMFRNSPPENKSKKRTDTNATSNGVASTPRKRQRMPNKKEDDESPLSSPPESSPERQRVRRATGEFVSLPATNRRRSPKAFANRHVRTGSLYSFPSPAVVSNVKINTPTYPQPDLPAVTEGIIRYRDPNRSRAPGPAYVPGTLSTAVVKPDLGQHLSVSHTDGQGSYLTWDDARIPRRPDIKTYTNASELFTLDGNCIDDMAKPQAKEHIERWSASAEAEKALREQWTANHERALRLGKEPMILDFSRPFLGRRQTTKASLAQDSNKSIRTDNEHHRDNAEVGNQVGDLEMIAESSTHQVASDTEAGKAKQVRHKRSRSCEGLEKMDLGSWSRESA